MTTAYRELGLLAEGGMATVARAVREPDGLPVVIKRVRPPLCFDASYLRLFADEAAVHAALDDDHVVRLLDRGEDALGPFLVFEHVDGTDLGVLLEGSIAAGAPLDVELVLAIAIPLMSGLAFVHEACRDGACLDVVHRDVSPGNVLVGEDGAVKLADFGVAASRLKTEQTVAGELKGKFAYMAPEQTRGEPPTPRTDLFAVGVVLWECLQNRRLWDAATDADVVRAVREDPAPAMDTARVGDEFADLVALLLQKDPALRPPSARAVRDRLREIALDRGLDDGLGRIVARAVRGAPRRKLGALPAGAPVDGRRRTQRVAGAPLPAARTPRVPRARVAVAVGVVAAVVGLAATQAARRDTEVVTELPAMPPPPTTTTNAPRASAPPTNAPPAAAERAVPALAKPSAVKVRMTGGATGPTARRPTKGATPAPAGGFGKVSVTSEPWARVSVDGVVVASETPLVGFTLPAGRHTLTLENPVVGARKSVVVEISGDGHERVFVDLSR